MVLDVKKDWVVPETRRRAEFDGHGRQKRKTRQAVACPSAHRNQVKAKREAGMEDEDKKIIIQGDPTQNRPALASITTPAQLAGSGSLSARQDPGRGGSVGLAPPADVSQSLVNSASSALAAASSSFSLTLTFFSARSTADVVSASVAGSSSAAVSLSSVIASAQSAAALASSSIGIVSSSMSSSAALATSSLAAKLNASASSAMEDVRSSASDAIFSVQSSASRSLEQVVASASAAVSHLRECSFIGVVRD
jgi:hypothetical protein